MKSFFAVLGFVAVYVYAFGCLVITSDCEQREKAGYVACSLYSLSWPVTLPLSYMGRE